MKQLAVSLALLMTLATPSHAAIQNSADFENGSTMGVGLIGFSYDYAFGNFSLGGLVVNPTTDLNQNISRLFSGSDRPFKLGTRIAWRYMQRDGISVGNFVGLSLDPGYYGSKLTFLPDVGVSLAYRFTVLDLPAAIRFNMSMAFDMSASADPEGNVQSRNVFQRLKLGPNTGFEFAVMPLDYLEITLGGGTLLGARMKF